MNKKTLVTIVVSNMINLHANASTISVDASCSLTDAILSAEIDYAIGGCSAGSGDDQILLSPNSTHTFTEAFDNAGDLSTATPEISSAITIQGNNSTIVSLGPAFRLFSVHDGGELSLNQTTITGGNLPYVSYGETSGSCILIDSGSTVQLTESAITGCLNAAIEVKGDSELTLQNSTMSQNRTGLYSELLQQYYSIPGAIRSQSSTITISESQIVDNYSVYNTAGISLSDSILLVSNSNISNNISAGGSGSAIAARNNSIIEIDDTTILRNDSGRYGGAILTSSNTSLNITGSTISRNTTYTYYARDGGAMFLGGVTTISNSTINNNRVPYTFRTLYGSANSGGAIFNSGDLTIINSTLVDNVADEGDAHHIRNTGTLTLKNTIISGDEETELCISDSDVNAGQDNIIQDGSCGSLALEVDPLLEPIQDNDGQTTIFRLLAGSPAIDMGDVQACSSSPVFGRDQRGYRHVGRCDIGSFEFGAIGVNEFDGSLVSPLLLLLLDDEE